ncbi:DUF5719 family protein [Cellulomonas dongxiuzhuiae]|uniref:Large extracellular alpha-helical protein n=1 Tax=Cellulomonas dongxiuzhuiae TaxID=2819979 RepID=A0ABX8GFV3_9CELL|nr:DUF5719 family protein [Cellulomonas dongxiuzhuiae]MBO3093928.1 hypothetical protein [Cellulomonas dongxiuzhuiae]QWC15012.1 hypothetical protein KKR89_11770 [Cellulomonas dongxiuzhuiae]
MTTTDPERAPAPREDRFRRAARAASGVLVLALAGGAVAAAARVGDAPVAPLAAVQVEVAPTPVTLQCPGPVLLPERTVRGDAAFDPAPVPAQVALDAVTAAGAGAGPLAVVATGPTGAAADAPGGGGSLHLGDVDAPLAVRAQPRETSPVAAASVASVVTDGDARGLAAASCRTPSSDDWLVGAATAVGSTATLVLTNPGLTVAQVELEVFGPTGPVDVSTTQHVVAAGGTKQIDLGGLAADQAALVVHLTAAGGQVAAHVQDTAVRGFTPAGTDLVVPGDAPATRQVVTGLVVAESQVGSPDAPVLRLLAPRDATTARIALLGGDGPVALPGAQDVALAAGEVTDVPLGGLPEGVYTVVVDAQAPVVAGAVTTSVGQQGGLDDEQRVERAWSASSALDAHGVVALPRGTDAAVVVGAVGRDADDTREATATLRVLGGDGRALSEHDVRVDAGTTGAWRVADLAEGAVGVELVPEGDVAVAWAVSLRVEREDGSLMAVLGPVPVTGSADARDVREDARPARG